MVPPPNNCFSANRHAAILHHLTPHCCCWLQCSMCCEFSAKAIFKNYPDGYNTGAPKKFRLTGEQSNARRGQCGNPCWKAGTGLLAAVKIAASAKGQVVGGQSNRGTLAARSASAVGAAHASCCRQCAAKAGLGILSSTSLGQEYAQQNEGCASKQVTCRVFAEK